MAKATIVSLVPFPIHEPKPGLIPPFFDMPACPDGEIQILVIDDSSFGVYIDEARGSLRIVHPADKTAESVVNDYIQGQLMRNDTAYPGIFWVPGAHTKESIKKEYAAKIKVAYEAQLNWFKLLVAAADDDWNQYRKHKMITDIQRYAGRALGLEGKKEWLAVFDQDDAKTKCPACGGTILQGIVICPHCSHIIDEARFQKMKFATKAG